MEVFGRLVTLTLVPSSRNVEKQLIVLDSLGVISIDQPLSETLDSNVFILCSLFGSVRSSGLIRIRKIVTKIVGRFKARNPVAGRKGSQPVAVT